MNENTIEQIIVPRNPSSAKMVKKEEYNLFAPLARKDAPGIASFSEEHFVVINGKVSLRNKRVPLDERVEELETSVEELETSVEYLQGEIDATKIELDVAYKEITDKIEHPSGSVFENETAPVSGGAVHSAISVIDEKFSHRVSYLEEVCLGNTYAFETVEAIADRHDVLTDAMPHATLDRIGGYTRKSKNLFRSMPNMDYGTLEVETDKEYNPDGIHITSTYLRCCTDENGYLNISTGWPIGGGNSIRLKHIAYLGHEHGETFTLSARYISGKVTPSDMGDCCLVLGDNPIAFPTSDNPLVTMVGVAPSSIDSIMPMYCCLSDDYKIALQIEEGTTATEYVPYWVMRSAKVTAIKSMGANLLPYPYTDTTTYRDGITFTDNGDGSITANGTATNTVFFVCNQGLYLPAGQYHISSHTNLGSSAHLRWGINAYETSFTSTGETKSVEIRITNGTTLNNVVFKPMLNIGTTALPYKPYVGVLETYTVPQELQALDGYGVGINVTNTNGIDLETKTFKKRVKELVLTGDHQMSTWTFNGVKGVMFPNVLDVTLNRDDGLCTDAEVSTSANISRNELWIGLDNRVVYWCGVLDALNMTESSFREYLRDRYNSGNPVRILYPSSTYEETDVSEYIPDTVYLKVEAGGYIVGENEDGIESNLGITYQVKL